MIEINRKKGESIEHLIKRFNKAVNKDKIIPECVERECYISQSERKRQKSDKAKLANKYKYKKD